MATRKADDAAVSAEVVEIHDAIGRPVRREGDVVGDFLTIEQETTDVTSEQAYRTIIERIMSSDSVDSLLAEIEPNKPEDFLGKDLTIPGFSFNQSDFEVGPRVYATIIVHPDFEEDPVIVNTGDQGLMAQLEKAKRMGWLPLRCRFVQGKKPNKSGRFPIRLGKASI